MVNSSPRKKRSKIGTPATKASEFAFLTFCCRRKAANRTGNDAEPEHFRMLRLLAPHREELRVRERRLVSAHVSTQSRDGDGGGKLATTGRIDAGVASVVAERQRAAARQDIRLIVDYRNEVAGLFGSVLTSGSFTLESES